MMLPVYSQTSSKTSNDSCIVPVSTLKNALIVLRQRDNLKKQLEISRDSISILSDMCSVKDSIINNQKTVIDLYVKNELNYVETIKTKDVIVEEYKKKYIKQKNLKIAGFGVGALGIIIAILK